MVRGVPRRLSDAFCPGDAIHVKERSRADAARLDQSALRLNAGAPSILSGRSSRCGRAATPLTGGDRPPDDETRVTSSRAYPPFGGLTHGGHSAYSSVAIVTVGQLRLSHYNLAGTAGLVLVVDAQLMAPCHTRRPKAGG